jgi:3-oxoacyl-[acyl-carrier protein] reductase
MNLDIRNKVAIIGGSSKGLGKGCALQLAKEGVNIVLCSNEIISLEKTKIEIESFGVSVLPLLVDMSSKNDNEKIVNEAIKKYGIIDILINNSGGPKAGTFFDFSDEDWNKAYNDILMYVIRLDRMVIPYMRQNKWGRIINITSLSVKEPAETLILSNVFRSGVVSMAKSLSKELIKDNITINNICPGAFKTDRAIELMQAASIKENKAVEEIENEAVKTMPLGRFQTPEELGDLVAFLCSELARGITGTTIQIDGGIYNGLM